VRQAPRGWLALPGGAEVLLSACVHSGGVRAGAAGACASWSCAGGELAALRWRGSIAAEAVIENWVRRAPEAGLSKLLLLLLR
jgi:hypothetical protein